MFVISGLQVKMARAALDLTTRDLGKKVNLSAMAISRYENGDEKVVSVETAKKIEGFFNKKRVYFGPKDGLCLDQNVFKQERWYHRALFQLLVENDLVPTSKGLIDAHQRSQNEENSQ